MGDFKLSATLAGHEDDVRGVCFPNTNTVITASRDATTRLWRLENSTPPSFDDTIASHGQSFINCVAYVPPSKNHPNGLIVSGGKDTIIEVREPGKRPDDNADAMLLGHDLNVCSLDVSPDGKYIVSGSWDGSAKVWPVDKWECEMTMKGHEGSVWAVLAYDRETIITGSADKFIRLFHRPSGKLLLQFQGSDQPVRALTRLPSDHTSGAAFASASNDGTICLWTMRGKQVAQLHGHDSFVYSLAYLPSGELVSSGEDRTTRVWRNNECIQTITHPAISVWSVAACAESGDIVTGASDKIARVFTRSAERTAPAQAIRLFENSVKQSSIPQQQSSEPINKENLPGPEFLQAKRGTKEGQVQMIRESDGSVTAHMWSNSEGAWTAVGTVVDAAASSGRKVAHNGQDYDYVFDVDIEDGKPALKLPYNLSSNPYDAASKFITTNELPVSYLEQVANFIVQNTQGATLGQSSTQPGPAPAGADPWGSEARYRPGGATPSVSSLPSVPSVLPIKTYLSILTANVGKMHQKLNELNTALIQRGDKSLSMNPTELRTLTHLTELVSSTTILSKTQIAPDGLQLVVKLTTTWPYADRLPTLDLLRLLAVSPSLATYTNPQGQNIIDVIEAAIDPKDSPGTTEALIENNTMLATRAVGNLFETPEGRKIAWCEFDRIHAFVSAPLHTNTKNRNLLVAAATLYVNYAVYLTTPDEGKGTDCFEQGTAMLEVLVKLVAEKDGEVVYRALVALGTLLGAAAEIVTAAKEVYGAVDAVKGAVTRVVEPRVKNIGREVLGLLA